MAERSLKVLMIAIMALLRSQVAAQEPSAYATDSVHYVGEVVASSRLTFRETVPHQTLKGVQLQRLNQHSVADALRYFAGVQLKDYGGVGGIKTVNLRSMGSHHVGVYYDGVRLGNAQNGQVDLGQLSMDNVEEIAVYNGQKSAIFQSAQDFASAGSVYIRTRHPRFVDKGRNIIAKAQGASASTLRLSAVWEQKISSRLCSSISAGFVSSSGEYHFRYRRVLPNGDVAYDTTAVRQNGDVIGFRGEGNLFGSFDGGGWMLKAYTFHSQRGIPGAIVNNVWRRGERQGDHNTFAQAQGQKEIGERLTVRAIGKYAYYDTHYANRDTTTMLVDNNYWQSEAYVSAAAVVELLPDTWSLSVAADALWNKLTSDIRQFAHPRRWQTFVSVATAFNRGRLSAQGSLQMTSIVDRTTGTGSRADEGETVARRKALTPALFVGLGLCKGLTARVFAKKSYRMPTFNDLYYTEIGNSALKPEIATQYDIGANWDKDLSHGDGPFKLAAISADIYYNTVRDKVIAYPKGQQFRWTMLNLGRVHILGLDANARVECRIREAEVSARLQYTYQKAEDVSRSTDSFYGHQIPYVPWHSGTAVLTGSLGSWGMAYSFIYTGERYNQQENIEYNHTEPWYTSDVSLSYQRKSIRLTLDVNNILDQDYDVILNYPMPGRNYALQIEMRL